MESLGSYLKRERELKGLSLEDLSSLTRVNSSLLQKIEEDHFEELAHGTVTRGYLKSYGQSLGLKTQDILFRYEQWAKNAKPRENPFKKWERMRQSNPLLVILLLIALVIALASFLSSR